MISFEVTGTTINLHWSEFIDLNNIDYSKNHEVIKEIPEAYGIYIFWRQYGDKHECLYIGKTTNLRSRIRTQLNARGLIEHVKGAKRGKKILSYAELDMHANCYVDDYLDKVETFFISEALSQGHDLYNQQKTKFYGNPIISHGENYPNIFEDTMYMPNK
ncbi:GIY-YIG nuclease family protein [Proteus mirabilis]|uniref:GIY-YIG nuclease family protein n=1 Tax=Proteus TaxID=583 RepID=UPI0018C51143|nr:GIY-YIG nuclease family protein [Proteus vulgaris]MBG3079846.1 GIY-YIG nuclease family protein [Proteus mirabilis]QPN88539.1 GIY-YIG nuclease family protein [Proteus vulgaris]